MTEGPDPPEDAGRRQALGAFLRARRARLAPETLGFGPGTRRRTPGLRREEVAERGGISTTWYTWMEQGREVKASAAALDRLAGALSLTRAERAYLFDLAGRRDPKAESAEPAAAPGLAAMIATIAAPAYLLDAAWNARAWNRPAEHLFIGWLDRPEPPDRPSGRPPNLLRYIFLSSEARRLIPDWEARARRVLAEFRAESGRRAPDAEAETLVADLKAKSPFFARAWDEQQVLSREGGLRTFRHPDDGPLRFEQIALLPAARPGLILVVLVPLPVESDARRW